MQISPQFKRALETEYKRLRRRSEMSDADRVFRVVNRNWGVSLALIARLTGLSSESVRRALKTLIRENKITSSNKKFYPNADLRIWTPGQ